MPEFTAAVAYRLPGFREGLKAARRLTLWGGVRLLRLLDPSEAGLLYGVDGAVLMVEFEAPDKGLLEAMEGYVEKVASESGGSRVEGVYERWARARYMYDEHFRQLWSAGLWVDTIDTAAPWSRAEELNRSLIEGLSRVPGVVAVTSHAGHFYTGGAALYHTVVMERRLDTYWRVWAAAARTVERLGGSLSHQHGWGLVRKPYLGLLGDNYRLFCRVKETLDSSEVLNPHGLPSRCGRLGQV
ncbi:FAD-binding oxidoreductase [Aeropyrum camini]|uniref:FAD-binding oxidoreductase n=1 Tax=Aeropyrum camini TaxID=229980 RepID=UPI002108846B|nr:FAD-linked oxidase C-terminal domain-containing protein [Aeropyrum camini]